jgi:hypothetical protein
VLNDLSRALEKYWFVGDARPTLDILRRLWAIIVLQDIVLRWIPDWNLLFPHDAIFRVWKNSEPWNLLRLLDDQAQVAAVVLLILTLIALMSGWGRTKAMASAFYLYTSFAHLIPDQNISHLALLRYIGFLLIFIPSQPEHSGQWLLRLIQFRFAGLYLAAALYKLNSGSWLTGDAVFLALQTPSTSALGKFVMANLPSNQWLFLPLNYLVLAAELFIGPGLLIPRLRRYALVTAALLHANLFIFMSLYTFQLTMFMGLVAFLDRKAWCWTGFNKSKGKGDLA